MQSRVEAQRRQELEARYGQLTKQIWAIQTDLDRALLEHERLPLRELLADRERERSEVGNLLDSLEAETPATEASQAPVKPTAPFVGLRPFRPEDASLFYGRTKLLNDLRERLLDSNWPLLVVNGLSGVGKSSLLSAGLIPMLREQGYVVVNANILDSPESDVIQGILRSYPDVDKSGGILEALQAICLPHKTNFLIIDQLERGFPMMPDREEHVRFWRAMGKLVRGDLSCPVKVVFAIRSDWIYAFQSVPTPQDISVFSFLFLVEPLTPTEAQEAFVGPLERIGISYEPELIDVVIHDLVSEDGEIAPPHIQIVGEALYTRMRNRLAQREGPEELTLADYQGLRGARTIIREHLVRMVEFLGPDAQAGWQILVRLVSSDNRRLSRRAEELQGVLSFQAFERIVNHFNTTRLVTREFSSIDNAPVYTLTHDYLIEEINQHFKERSDLQSWKRAEQYLDTGLADWRDAQQLGRSELLLDRERYSDVWSQRTSLGNVTAEANEFLLLSALHNGQPGFAYWMAQLPTEDSGKALEVVKSRLLSPDIEVSQAAQEAVRQAIIDGQLSDEQQRTLKTLLWDAFDREVAPTSDDSTDTSADPRRIHRIAASQLWMLRKHTNATELARFGPVVARGWIAKHGKQLALPIIAALATTVLILAALALQARLKGTWTQTTNLYAGPVAAAELDSDDLGDLWAITPRGPQQGQVMTLLHRPANGSTWQVASESIMSDDMGATPPTVLLALGQRIYVGIYSRGILRSTDYGVSWQLINRGLGSYDIRDLVADPDDPNTLYAASGDQRGVWRSLDGGDTWEGFSDGELFGASVLSLEWTMTNDNALLAGTNDGRIAMRMPTDNAWQLVSAWPGAGEVRTLTAEPARREVVYAGTSTGKILRSDNGGLDWYLLVDLRESDEGIFQINALAIASDQPETVYLDGYGIGGNRLWKGTQGEDQVFVWEPLAAKDFTRERVRELLFVPSSNGRMMVAAGDAGMFESDDDGQTWSLGPSFNSPLASIGGLAVSPVVGSPVVYAVVQGAAFTSQNPEEGEWVRGEGLLAQYVRAITVDPNDPMTAFAGALLLNEWPLFVTRDGGKHWTRTLPPEEIPVALLNDISAVEAVANGNGQTTIYAGTNGCGVLYWPDTRGAWQTWERQDCQVGSTAPSVVIDIAPAPDNPQYVVVAADTNRVYLSSDAGRQWELAQFTSMTEITALAADPQLAGRFYLVAGTGGFWRSEDGGLTWKKLGTEFDDKAIGLLAVVPGTSGRLFVGSGTGEVWSSKNGGDTWQRVEGTATGFNVTSISSMTVDGSDGSLLVGSRNGLYRYQPGTLIPDH